MNRGDAPARALVTGAARGLGLAVAEALLGAGSARVGLADRDDRELATVVDRLAARHGAERVIGCPGDVTDQGSVATMTEQAVAFAGGMDALVTCAGVISRGRSADHDWSLWQRDLEVNVGGTYRCARAAFPALRESADASVVTVGSLGSFLGMPQRPSYNTSKAAVLGLTRTLAFEAGPAGIRVNSLSPGPCRGARMTRNFTAEAAASGTSYAAAEEAFVSRAALHRLVEEDEVALAVLAMLRMPGLCGADIDLSAGMIAPA